MASASASPAAASPHVRIHALSLAHVTLPRPHLPTFTKVGNHVDSGNWSGYADAAKSGVSLRYIQANWNIPSINCANSQMGTSGYAYDSNWVGLDGYTSGTVEQTGTSGYCYGTTSSPQYYAWYEMYPLSPVAYSGVSPGDAINASVYYNSSANDYSITLTDLTTGGQITTTQTCPSGSTCKDSSAEVITEDPGSSAPGYGLADFGQANYTNAAVTSRSGTKGNLNAGSLWNSDDIWSVASGSTGDTLAEPGPLEGGQAFYLTWINSL
jgi:hypothetical protein